MSKLLPYEAVLKTCKGDSEAVSAVLLHYTGCICCLPEASGQVNAEVEDYVKQRLTDCQFKLRFDEPSNKSQKLNTSRHRRGQREW